MKYCTLSNCLYRLINSRPAIGAAKLIIASVLLLSAIAARPQNERSAKDIYASAKDSVFLVYMNDTTGSPTALGTAFVIAPHLLATNAHVVNAGTPVLAVGPVRVPLKVMQVDQKNDLAILSVGIDLVSKPLPLGSSAASPGDQVFAIGNPEGLENTISQGIVSGLRTLNGRDLIQITSPISHGSSGGPVLNAHGQVVGVAVGMLQDGQNLNFAVPVRYVRALLEEKPGKAMIASECATKMTDLNDLFTQWNQEDYSEDSSSPYQQHEHQIIQSEKEIVDGCVQPDVLQQVACFGTKAYEFSDSGIAAARRLLEVKPSADYRALLAYVLFDRAQDEDLRTALFSNDPNAKEKAQAEKKTFMSLAGQTASGLTKVGGNSFLVASYVLGGVKEDANDIAGAIAMHTLETNSAPSVCGNDLALAAYRSLIVESESAGLHDQTEAWFRRYAEKYQPAAYEWDSEGDRLQSGNNIAGAADAYERAAAAATKVYGYDYCYASTDRYFQPTTDADAVLADGRKCIDESVTDARDYAKKHYENKLPGVYDAMAMVLESRGVHEQAYEYIKSSLAAKPDNPFALYDEAAILESLGRYTECISAAQAAIRVSDGKYSLMQERLGDCYFDTRNWTEAAASYRIAAQGDNTNAAAAFNLGLSLLRQGFTIDARQWFRTALQRNPNSELRGKIMSELQ